MLISILLKDGKHIIQHGVIYLIFTGNFLVVTLDTQEQFRIPASSVDVFDMEKE